MAMVKADEYMCAHVYKAFWLKLMNICAHVCRHYEY